MACDESNDFFAIDSDECDAWGESMLRGELSCEVADDAVVPVLPRFPIARARMEAIAGMSEGSAVRMMTGMD